MKENERITKVILSEPKLKEIINILKEYSFSDLPKDQHYYDSLMFKSTDEKELIKIFPQFDLLKMAVYRERINKRKRNNYDIYYEIEKKKYVVFCIDLEKNPPNVINGYPINRDFNTFKKSVIKKYGRLII